MRIVPRFLATGLLAPGLLAACTVGPDYKGPPAVASDPVAPGGFARATDVAFLAGPPIARWWDGMNDVMLGTLINQALANSPTIDQAQARIHEAGSRLSARRADALPSIGSEASDLRTDLPAAGPLSNLGLYSAGLNASWEPDLFGGKRRGVEQARATVGQRFADLADAQVSLSALVGSSYVRLRAVQEKARLNAQAVLLERRALDLARRRYVAGTGSTLQIARLETQLENERALDPQFASQIDAYRDQLAVLTGRRPGALDVALTMPTPIPAPPVSVSIGDPASLIGRRPDIRAAERALAASTAGIGIAKAWRLPGLRFFGVLGIGGTDHGPVIDPVNPTSLLAPMLNWALLDFGRGSAVVNEATAKNDVATARYREVVLAALQDAETSLSRFGNTRLELQHRLMALASAQRAAELGQQRVVAQTSTIIDELDIERQRVSAAMAVIDSRAQLTCDFISVEKALGLGWSEPNAAL